MARKSDFATYTLKFRDAKGLHTLKFLLASSAMSAFADKCGDPKVQTAAWFSAGGHCFASFTRESKQGVLPL